MDPKLHLLVVVNNEPGSEMRATSAKRGAFCVEVDRRGVFVSVGRRDVYLCTEPEPAWSFAREPGGFDTQMWRRLSCATGAVDQLSAKPN